MPRAPQQELFDEIPGDDFTSTMSLGVLHPRLAVDAKNAHIPDLNRLLENNAG
jgi:hypothetical protein